MILTTGASRRATLTVVRSLGRKNLKVSVGDYTRTGTAFLSKYCSEKVIYPNPQTNPEGYFNKILSKIETGKYEVLMPVHDFELFPILKNRRKIERYTLLPFVDFDIFMKTINKYDTIEIAKSVGVKVPKTYRAWSIADLQRISKDFDYPGVVKPISQTVWDFKKGAKTRYVTKKNYIKNKNDLIRFFENVRNPEEYLIQEYVAGRGAGVSYLFNKGNMRAFFSYMRVREYPITGGPSTLRVGIKHKEMIDAGKRILEKMKWHGIAMVEFKLTPTGEPVLMEINGRFWGSIALAYHSGVDFPYLLYRLAVDGDIKPVLNYKEGVLCRWLIPGDMLNFYFRLKAERDENIGAFKDFFKFRNLYYDYLDRDDPLPVIGALLTTGRYFGEYVHGKRTISGEYK